jgi:hypothetical protein
MPSRIRKISKRRKLTLRKNKKLKKRLTKMRGGAFASAPSSRYSQSSRSSAPSSRPTAPHARVQECFTLGDPNLILIGISDLNYLSASPSSSYDPRRTMYSDHAPIIYNLREPSPITNPYISIITWNVGQFGDEKHTNPHTHAITYNHKFNMERVETAIEYNTRLENLVRAMATMLSENIPGNPNPYYPQLVANYPFLFCQELPTIEPFRSQFIGLLTANGLGLLCDGDRANPNEFALIVKRRMPRSQRFTVLNKGVYMSYTYPDGSLLFPNSPTSIRYPNGLPNRELRRFEIYYYESRGITYYYVNIHAPYTTEPRVIVNFLNRIIDTIQIYRASRGQNINGVTIYLIGDYNFNIASPAINDLISTSYRSNPLNLFANPNPDLRRAISSMYKLTTQNAVGNSLQDNFGTPSQCNIDCILKLDLAQA